MMEIRAYKCDVCSREKQQSNHWYIVRIGTAFHIYYWESWREGREGAGDDSIDIKHVCGQECLGKLLQLFLDRKT